MNLEINTEIFSQEEGNVRGVVTAMVQIEKNGKPNRFRLGHAYLMADKPATLTLTFPKGGVSYADAVWLANALQNFAEAVHVADIRTGTTALTLTT
jgi:hypothetical protein